MEKIFYTIVFSFVVSLLSVSFLSTPAMTCSRSGQQVTTGAACSIAELNNMSKYKYAKENSIAEPPSEKNLRPVPVNSSEYVNDGINCRLGLCITEKIFKGE